MPPMVVVTDYNTALSLNVNKSCRKIVNVLQLHNNRLKNSSEIILFFNRMGWEDLLDLHSYDWGGCIGRLIFLVFSFIVKKTLN